MADITSDEQLFAALAELQTLTKAPLPLGEWPPWSRIRAALPADLPLPDEMQHVLIDLELDAEGQIVAASVGHRPAALDGKVVVAECVDEEGRGIVREPATELLAPLAEIVAAAHVGGRFTPAELDGVAVPVRLLRVGIELVPSLLRDEIRMSRRRE